MPQFREMDDKATFFTQLEQEAGPVILINTFLVEPHITSEFLKLWAVDAAIMKRQPGFISAQLHKGIAGSQLFLNYAVWDTVADLRRALNEPNFHTSQGRIHKPAIIRQPYSVG